MHRLLVAALLLIATPAQAHTGPMAGFAAGFAHPLLGLDHLLAMLAVGLWAARIGGHARWAVPLAFVAAMALGAALPVPMAEPGILASVLILGLLAFWAPRLPLWAPAAVVALFALAHGHAHGTEVPGVTAAIGFLLATAALHGLGLLLPYARWLGLGVAATGLVLAVS